MKAYKVVLLIVDHDECGEEGITQVLEDARYPNRCISPRVMDVAGVDIGEWHDAHPLNIITKTVDEYRRLFPKTDHEERDIS